MTPSERSPLLADEPAALPPESGTAGGLSGTGATPPLPSLAGRWATRGLVGAAVFALLAMQFIPTPVPTSSDLAFLASDLARATLARAAYSARAGVIVSDSSLYASGALGSPYSTFEESMIVQTPPSWRTRMSNSRYICEQEGQLASGAPLVRPIICRVNETETVWAALPATLLPVWLVDHRRWRVEPVTESAQVAFVITADTLTPSWHPLSLDFPAPASEALGSAGIP